MSFQVGYEPLLGCVRRVYVNLLDMKEPVELCLCYWSLAALAAMAWTFSEISI